jgi:hypothetical protein
MNAENMPLYARRNNNSTSLKKRGTVTLKKRPGTVTVNSGNNQLLLVRPRNTVNARTKDEILHAKVDLVIQQGNEAIAQMRAMMQSQAATEDTQARIQNVAEATKETQTVMKRVLDRVDVGVKQIATVTNQILGITQRTEKLAKTFRNRGARGIIQEVLFDEWLIFYMYMLLHPYAPTTTELFGSVWVGVLAARRFMKLRGDMRKGEILAFSVAGVVNNYLTSPWKAIYLMYWYNQKFQSMHGTQEYNELFPGGPEAIFKSFTSEIIHTDINNLSKLAQNTPIALAEAKEWIVDFFSKHPNALEVLGEVCPTWASDKTAFFNCLSQFAVGNVSVMVKGVATNLAVPGVLWEGSQYMNSEKQVMYWTMSMVWQGVTLGFGELFSSVGTYMKGTIDGYMTGAVCQYVPSMLRMGYSCEVPPVAEAAAAFAASATATATAVPTASAASAAAAAVPTSVAWSFRSLLPWGGGNSSDAVLSLRTQNNLDQTLSTSSLYLIMAYSINPITEGKVRVNKDIIRNLEGLVYSLIKIESSEELMGDNKMIVSNSRNSRNSQNSKLTLNKLMNAKNI